MHDKYGTSQDPSCYPGSNQLINLLDIHSTEELEEAELVLTNFRLEQFSPNFNDLTFDYLKNIHHFLFQDIYIRGPVKSDPLTLARAALGFASQQILISKR